MPSGARFFCECRALTKAMAQPWRWVLLVGVLALPVWCEGEVDEPVDGADEGEDDQVESESLTAEQMRGMHGKFDADKNGKVSLDE